MFIFLLSMIVQLDIQQGHRIEPDENTMASSVVEESSLLEGWNRPKSQNITVNVESLIDVVFDKMLLQEYLEYRIEMLPSLYKKSLDRPTIEKRIRELEALALSTKTYVQTHSAKIPMQERSRFEGQISQLKSFLRKNMLPRVIDYANELIETQKTSFLLLSKRLSWFVDHPDATIPAEKLASLKQNQLPDASYAAFTVRETSEHLLFQVYHPGWFDTESAILNPIAKPYLSALLELFLSINTDGLIGIAIKGHSDTDIAGYRGDQCTTMGLYIESTQEIRDNCVLDQIKENGEIATYPHYYTYRIIPSKPQRDFLVVKYDRSYIDFLNESIHISWLRSRAVDSYFSAINEYYANRSIECKTIGVGFLEPVVSNLPLSYSSEAQRFIAQEKKGWNRRIELDFFKSTKKILTLMESFETQLIFTDHIEKKSSTPP